MASTRIPTDLDTCEVRLVGRIDSRMLDTLEVAPRPRTVGNHRQSDQPPHPRSIPSFPETVGDRQIQSLEGMCWEEDVEAYASLETSAATMGSSESCGGELVVGFRVWKICVALTSTPLLSGHISDPTTTTFVPFSSVVSFGQRTRVIYVP